MRRSFWVVFMKKVKLGDVCEKGSSNIAQKDLEKSNGKYPIYGASGLIKNVDFYKQDKEYIAVVKDGAGVGRTILLPAYSSIIGTMQYILPNDSIHIKYLYYVLTWMNLSKYCTGATIPHIYFKDYKDEEFYLPSLEEQKAIAGKLDKVSGLIEKRKTQLEELDLLIKSRFIEMFGDPITNSRNLPTERMELRFNLKAGITTSADTIHDFEKGVYEIPCYGGNGIRGYVKEKSYTGHYPIIGRQGALCGNVQYAIGDFHATEHAVLVSPLKDDNAIWVYHLLKLMDLYRYHTGAAQPGLAVKTLNTVEVIVTDKSKQEQFASFVEQVDKSKFEIQKSLEKLEILKKSLMQQYFG